MRTYHRRNTHTTRRVSAPATTETTRILGSPQQMAIWDELQDGTTHLVVVARAGTGKTTTIVEGLRYLSPSVKAGLVAFNKHIANELSTRIPPGAVACTLHSLGFKALRNRFGGVRVDDRGDKVQTILTALFGNDDSSSGRFAVNAASRLLSLCKATLTSADNWEELEALAANYSIELNGCRDRVFEVIAPALRQCRDDHRTVDFDDMIWLPVELGLFPEQYDVLLVDEAQDLNRAQQELALRACPNGRTVLVGDDRQSIYGFRAADTESIPRMTARLRETDRGVKVMPLTVSRRCPVNVIQLAQNLVPDIEHLSDAPPGVVEAMTDEAATDVMRPGDMVLCRTNAPLIQKAYHLIRRNIPCRVVGRDIGKGLQALIKRLHPNDLDDLLVRLTRHEEKERESIVRRTNGKGNNQVAALEDRCDCLRFLVAASSDLTDLRNKIDELFADLSEGGTPKDKVVLSSVHRAKGLEAPRVYILRPELMPHKMAKTPDEVQQERNIAYVAATRVKFERGNSHTGRLIFVGNVSPAFSPPPPA